MKLEVQSWHFQQGADAGSEDWRERLASEAK